MKDLHIKYHKILTELQEIKELMNDSSCRIIIKLIIAITLLHLNLLTISTYVINSPSMVEIKNEDISIAGIFISNIPVYV